MQINILLLINVGQRYYNKFGSKTLQEQMIYNFQGFWTSPITGINIEIYK
jgi:hypothetical protein